MEKASDYVLLIVSSLLLFKIIYTKLSASNLGLLGTYRIKI